MLGKTGILAAVLGLLSVFVTPAAAVSVLDTTFSIDAANSSWLNTGIDVQQGDYVWLFAFGAATTYGSCGTHIGAYIVGSDNSYGGGMIPAESCGPGAVYKVGDGGAAALPTFAHIMNPWSGDSGELSVGFNDNFHSDNSGSLIVGVIRVRDEQTAVCQPTTMAPTGNGLKVTPNPSNRGARVEYCTPVEPGASVRIYDMTGKLVRVLGLVGTKAGRGHCDWDGCDGAGRSVSQGTYTVRLESAGGPVAEQVLVVR
jgi:hypothetical protein